jgi:hypothetical protein
MLVQNAPDRPGGEMNLMQAVKFVLDTLGADPPFGPYLQ